MTTGNIAPQKALRILLIMLIAVIVLLSQTRPISDFDFFWHLKTGEWIVMHQSLPEKDPFSFTTHDPPDFQARFILTAYWLSQVIYILLYRFFGFAGIFILRFILAGILLFLVLKRSRGDSIVILSLCLIGFSYLFFEVPLERPHVYSFIGFAALLMIIENIRTGNEGKRLLLALPVVMIVWANMHGGYVIGQMLILYYLFFDGCKLLFQKRHAEAQGKYRRLLIAGISGIACSLINPNTFHGIFMIFGQAGSMGGSEIIEYASSITTVMVWKDYFILLYWFLLLLALYSILSGWREIDGADALLIAATGIASFTTIRLIPFFLIAAVPIMSRLLSRVRLIEWLRTVMAAVAIVTVLVIGKGALKNTSNLARGYMIAGHFPSKATEFILRSGIRGNLFNYYAWGGYLICWLGPERPVFIDGRNLNGNIYETYRSIMAGSTQISDGKPSWKASLDNARVNAIVIPVYEILADRPVPLITVLLEDNDWKPVFYEQNELVFLRNSPENAYLIKYYSIPRELFRKALARHVNNVSGVQH